MRHFIKKQIIDLNLSRKQDVFRMQQLASDHYHAEMLPMLDKQFCEFSNEEEIIYIDKLELDLGAITEEQMEQSAWDHDLVSRFQTIIKQKLQEFVQYGKTTSHSKPILYCRQWLFYIRNGYLPWNTRNVDEEWRTKVLEAFAVDFTAISALRLLIINEHESLNRIVHQHEPAFLGRLAEVLSTQKQTNLPGAIDKLFVLKQELEKQGMKLSQDLPSKKLFQHYVWKYVLTIVATEKGELSTTKIITAVMALLLKQARRNKKIPFWRIQKPSIIKEIIKKFDEKELINKWVEENFSNLVNQNVPDKVESETEMTQEPNVNYSDSDLKLVPSNELLERKNPYQRNEDATSEMLQAENIDEDGIFVANAGLVLIHPFLTTYFKRLLLVNEGSFVDMGSKQKALHLLYYMATSKVEPEEHELVVPKFLCDWPLEMPVEKTIEISKEELEEAANLLEAVIEQWEILKKSSATALREGFLQRKGKIFSKNDNLYLQVESGAIDMLLDHLPWNLSIIKLPWMKQVLRVEWR